MVDRRQPNRRLDWQQPANFPDKLPHDVSCCFCLQNSPTLSGPLLRASTGGYHPICPLLISRGENPLCAHYMCIMYHPLVFQDQLAFSKVCIRTVFVMMVRLTLPLCVRLFAKAIVIFVVNVRDNVHQYGVLPAQPSHSFLLVLMLSVQGSFCMCCTSEMDV